MAQKREHEFGGLYGIFHALTPVLVVSDPLLVRKILIQDFDSFSDIHSLRFSHPIELEIFRTHKSDSWIPWRKAVTAAYSPLKLKQMITIVSAVTDVMMQQLEQIRDGEVAVDGLSLFTSRALQVVTSTAFGHQIDAFSATDALVHAINATLETRVWKVGMGWLMPLWLKAWIGFTMFDKEALLASDAIGQAVIRSRRQAEQHGKNSNDLTDLLMDVKLMREGQLQSSSDREIAANLMFVIMCAFDSNGLLSWTSVFMLAKHPNVQERLQQEVLRVTPDGNPGYDSLKDLKFMEAVLNEVLRMFPPSTYVERTVTKEYQLGGCTLPVGLDILIPTYLLHYNATNFPDPYAFDPDRFMEPGLREGDSIVFMPFGHGPRSCPAVRLVMLEAKVLLCRILSKFELRLNEEDDRVPGMYETVDELLRLSSMKVCIVPRT